MDRLLSDSNATAELTDRAGTSRDTLVQCGLLVAIALALRLAHLGSATPWYDEFWHLIAARSWLHDGTLAISGGQYTRAAWYTKIVAESLRVFGDTLEAGRIPALVAGALWVGAVFAWTRYVAGRLAGWTAGLLLALDPGAVFLSQYVRFYALHGLLVWTGLVCTYYLLAKPYRSLGTPLLGLAAAVLFGLANGLQESTLIAVAAAGLWAAVVLAGRLPAWLREDRSRKRNVLVVGAVFAMGAWLAWFLISGRAAAYWQSYTGAFYWMDEGSRNSRWYVWWLGSRYATLWTLFPVAIALAVARFPRPALFALTIFGISFLGVSFGSAKAERYLYFALPFFFVLWGMALVPLWSALRSLGGRAAETLGILRLGPRWPSRAGAVFAAGVVGFLASQTDALRTTGRMVFPGQGDRPYREADWSLVLPQLRTLVDSADVVLSSYVLKPIYYFGRGDAHLSWTETAEAGFTNGRPVEFALDSRTGLPTLSRPESLERVMRCYVSGLVLTERYHLNRPHLVPDSTTLFLRSSLEEVPLPANSWVVVFRWRHARAPDGPGCPPPGFRTRSGLEAGPSGLPLPR